MVALPVAGAFHSTFTYILTIEVVGASGYLGAAAATILTGSDSGPQPCALCALTVNEYS